MKCKVCDKEIDTNKEHAYLTLNFKKPDEGIYQQPFHISCYVNMIVGGYIEVLREANKEKKE